jgi:uncharacterized protein YbjT (DUF2867 family)
VDIFVTGATGVLGCPVVRLLVAAGHEIHGLSHSADNVTVLRGMGAEPTQADLFDVASLKAAVAGWALLARGAERSERRGPRFSK